MQVAMATGDALETALHVGSKIHLLDAVENDHASNDVIMEVQMRNHTVDCDDNNEDYLRKSLAESVLVLSLCSDSNTETTSGPVGDIESALCWKNPAGASIRWTLSPTIRR